MSFDYQETDSDYPYFDSAKGITISRSRVIQEFEKHGVPESEYQDFFRERPGVSSFDAQEVLDWLGY